jgi:hypothetical protein
VLLAALALTGLGSYYLTSDAARAINSILHESAGLLTIVPALVHWLARAPKPPSIAG